MHDFREVREVTAEINKGDEIGPARAAELLAIYFRDVPKLLLIAEAVENSPYDISPCHECGAPVVCLPEGLSPLCASCRKAASAAKEEDHG